MDRETYYRCIEQVLGIHCERCKCPVELVREESKFNGKIFNLFSKCTECRFKEERNYLINPYLLENKGEG